MSISSPCSKIVLTNQEPAFQELILLYTKEDSKGDPEIRDEVSSLQLKIYERIPIPDLPVNTSHAIYGSLPSATFVFVILTVMNLSIFCQFSL